MKQKATLFFFFIFFIAAAFSACSTIRTKQKGPGSQARVLIFSKTSGYYHPSIPDGIAALKELGKENDFEADTTKNAAYFVADSLAKYAAVIFLNTTGDVLNPQQEKAFENYIKDGGGFVGIHAASDTEFEWEWYNKLVGAHFTSHPQIQEANIIVTDKNHPATAFLGDSWQRRDEWYNFKNINPNIKVLAELDENSYKGGTNGDSHPIAWYHESEGGRAFYTGGGHTSESYKEPLFLRHLTGGILYAIGRESVK